MGFKMFNLVKNFKCVHDFFIVYIFHELFENPHDTAS